MLILHAARRGCFVMPKFYVRTVNNVVEAACESLTFRDVTGALVAIEDKVRAAYPGAAAIRVVTLDEAFWLANDTAAMKKAA
jgi:hypothetical protein